ncbi:S-adenosylmethionine synthase [Candidatus Uabimicrobium amorphum]|uniref:S-adenosylmethionine synthase n=2 Tax=Uabimicrobium amorphum TaxID=2596890 RepID=A0A5S9F2U1_UABAM|nr:S-adenosylmethionine synthase [Candidatus Uabimicrobium amorphum]
MGHPDKVADQISDAILDALLEQDPNSRVACETMVTTGLVVIAGEVTTNAQINYQEVVRNTIKDIGYTDPNIGFDYKGCGVMVTLDKQSADIAAGVDEGDDKEQGAGDQGMMFGYACKETPELMPLPMSLARKLANKLADVRQSGELEYLRPDGKTQVTINYEDGKPISVDAIVLSTQHAKGISQEKLREDIIEKVIKPTIPGELLTENTVYHINPTGIFEVGGPHGDCGLTGRKIIVDTYGGMGRHGGGAFSGKDSSKVDRSAAYMARYVAKNIVAADLADRCEVQLAYAIGVAAPVSIKVDTFGTGKVAEQQLTEIVQKNFSLKPKDIVTNLGLTNPIFLHTAKYGHFGGDPEKLPWEKTDKVDSLKNS